MLPHGPPDLFGITYAHARSPVGLIRIARAFCRQTGEQALGVPRLSLGIGQPREHRVSRVIRARPFQMIVRRPHAPVCRAADAGDWM